MQTKKSFKYWQWRVIICSMIGYSMFYFVRKNFSFAMPVLFTGFGIGFLSDTFGQAFWEHLFIIMAGVAVISAAVMVPIWNIKDDGYVHE